MTPRNWLYPLSAKSTRYFVDKDRRRTPDTCFGCFVHLFLSDRTDDHWYLTHHFNHVSEGDRIWPYYGTADGDQGVVGLARIIKKNAPFRDGTHGIKIQWDRDATHRLIRAAVPAEIVRHYVKWPRAAVIDLDRHSALVGLLEQASGMTVKQQAGHK